VVLPGRVDEVVPADPVAVAVTAGGDHFEVGVRELRGAGHGQRAPVDRVEPVRVEVAVQLAGTADTGTQQSFLGRAPDFRERLLERLQDAEVAATRTPGRLGLDAGVYSSRSISRSSPIAENVLMS